MILISKVKEGMGSQANEYDFKFTCFTKIMTEYIMLDLADEPFPHNLQWDLMDDRYCKVLSRVSEVICDLEFHCLSGVLHVRPETPPMGSPDKIGCPPEITGKIISELMHD